MRRGSGRLPDFVIIGAQRCGTTSLYAYLAGHPRVAPAEEKELHFFDLNWDRGVGWYRDRFASARRRRLRRRPLTGEASPYYVFHPHAPARMAEVLPEARLIVMLRDPVDRAFSHYKLGRGQGWEDLSFEEAIDREPERLAGELERMLEDQTYRSFAHQHYSYLARGRYVEHLRAWVERFPERLLVLRSEDLYRDPGTEMARVLAFLGLEETPHRPLDALNVSDPVAMDPRTRRRLAEHFRLYNRRLEELLGRKMGWDDA